MAFPDYKVLNVSSLNKYKTNSRTHSEDQVRQIANSIEEFGWTNPILIDDNNQIIAGHARLDAANILNITEVPCFVLSGLSDVQKRAYVIADNKLALNAGWDYDILRDEFQKLADADFSIELTGFGISEIADIWPAPEPDVFCDEDDVPEQPAEPTVQRGDVWLLGEHRLVCGDATDSDDVDKLMNGAKADMVFCDPPYGVDFEQGKFVGRDKKSKNRHFKPIINDNKKGEELREFLKLCFSNTSCIADPCVIYAWSSSMQECTILNSLLESDWHIQSQLIWNKTPFVIGRADYHWKHEVCWYGFKGKNHQWFGGRSQSTVWDVAKTNTSNLHPTMKPTALAEIACENSTKKGDAVLDFFGGSGSTLIACEKLGRKCYMMELDPKYCDIIKTRWENYTGKRANKETCNGAGA